MEKIAKIDLMVITLVSLVSATLYVFLGGLIMDYGREPSNPLILRFMPVLMIQFGMSVLGILIVLLKNKEKLSDYGLIKKNAVRSMIGCLLVSIPTVVFLWLTNDLHGFLPFQGMFLTKEILHSAFPINVIGYIIIALVWGMGEGMFYVVLSKKINLLKKPKDLWNLGAVICALIAISIHGMIGFDLKTIVEAIATFILMYGSIIIYDKTKNAWGNILIFFVIWNAL